MLPRRWLPAMALAALPLLCCAASPNAMAAKQATQTATAMSEEEFMASDVKIGDLQEAGKFSEADKLADDMLSKGGLSDAQRRTLSYEQERSRRIRMDYWLSKAKLLESVKREIRDVTDAEFDQWVAAGKLDKKEIDGQTLFVGSSISNLFFRNADLRARRIKPKGTEWTDFLLVAYKDVMRHPPETAQSTGEPHHFRIKMSMTLNKDIVEKGKTVRCWMPYPRQFEAADGVKLESSSPQVKWINAPDYPVRTLYFEAPSNGSEETEFTATYTLTTYARRNKIDPAVVAGADQLDNGIHDYYTRQQDHIVFTPEITALAAKITGSETNPAIRARLIYDWISKNIDYSYAREYSTLRNISLYCLTNGRGDCGQITLLYMTLCRASGIPARWQSGWVIYETTPPNLHDWCEIYLAPYGWVPVDANYSISIERDCKYMAEADWKGLKDFYFGGLDAYRMIANSEHSYPHYPAKVDFRSDDVDSQRGEMESEGKNIYFDQFDYHMDLTVLDKDDDADRDATADAAPQAPHAMLKPGLVR
ncbi:transglutaminase domain-containing protein [soil metagenome]